MARIRSIKPEFFINDDLADLEPLMRLFFIGLWTQADREGRMEYRPKRLKAALMPYDECDIDKMVKVLVKTGFVTRYEVDGHTYLEVRNFSKHQSPNVKECASTIPAPCQHHASTSLIGEERKVEEGSGGDAREAPKNFPPCFLAEIERDGVTLSFKGHLLRDLEQYAGTWPSIPRNQGKLGARIREGCTPGCDGSAVRRCASALIRHARELDEEFRAKGKPFPVELYLYKAKEGAR